MNSGIRNIFIVLIIILLCSLAGVAFIIQGAFTTPTAEDIARICTKTDTPIQEYASCPEKTEKFVQETSTIAPAFNTPGFTYPASWSVMSTIDLLNRSRMNIKADEGVVISCSACEEKILPLNIITEPISEEIQNTGTNLFIATRYQETQNTVTSKKTLQNGTLYTISGEREYLGDVFSFTDLIFVGEEFISITETYKNNLEKEFFSSQEDYQAFLTSFDFSLME